MEYRFYIDGLKPISCNSSHYGASAGYSKKPATRYWEKKLKNGMLKYPDHIKSIQNTFIRDAHVLTRQYIFFYPSEMYWTKKGELSLHTQDVSNISKIPDDEVFVRVLKIDDKFIQRGSVEKIPWLKPKNGCLVIVNLEKREAIESRAAKWIAIAEAS